MHVVAAAARVSCVWAREEHDHRVAAELEHITTEAEDLIDQPLEDEVEDVVDVLGAGSDRDAASRSVIVVNPEMSKNASDPSHSTHPHSGESASTRQSAAIRRDAMDR